MANEIKSLGTVVGSEGGQFRLLFLALIPSADRVSYTAGDGSTQQVVPTPAPTDGEDRKSVV